MKLAMLCLALLGTSCVGGDAPIAPQAPKPAAPLPGTSAKPEAERQAAAPGRPQLASSPEGLMLPGGVLLIQQALTKRGYLHAADSGALDDETSVGLRNFQSDEKLARTGAPDRETLRRLGVLEDKVFRK